MPINIPMPALSPTMEKGNLAKWLKKEGDKVKPGDMIAEIETDKATMEVEAVDEGTLAKIVVPEGTADVPVNQLIAVLAGEGEDAEGRRRPLPAARPRRSPPKRRRLPRLRLHAAAPAKAEAPAPKPAAAPAPAPAAAPATNGHARVFSSPLARRLAKEAGIDLARIAGTGPHGRVVARDIAGAKEGKGLKAPGAAPGLRAAAPPARRSQLPADDKVRALYEDGSYEVMPHDNMRRVIAQRLTASTQNIPHFYLTVDCVIDKLMAAREEINASAPKNKEGKPAYKLSVNDFVVKALAVALQKIPNANVSWTESGMLKHKHSDIGVAVALPGGLITPIVRQAETKSLSTISNELKDMVARARARKLKPQEYQGGTSIGVEPRHVRHQGLHRRHQPAARDHPGGRRGRGAGDRAQGPDRRRDRDERDALVRSPRGRRRARRRADRRVQDADREPGDDGGVELASQMRLRCSASSYGHLIQGYRRFRTGTWAHQRARFDELSSSGQSPRTMLIACSDSRADPQMVFDAHPGELFVARNVANLVPPYGPDSHHHGTSAALEFGVRVLKVEHVVVMGHAMCGGIHALLHGAPEEAGDFVAQWVNMAGARQAARAARFRRRNARTTASTSRCGSASRT